MIDAAELYVLILVCDFDLDWRSQVCEKTKVSAPVALKSS